MDTRRLVLCITPDPVCTRASQALTGLAALLPSDIAYEIKDVTHLKRSPVNVVPCLVFLVGNKPIHRIEGEDISIERVLKTLKELG